MTGSSLRENLRRMPPAFWGLAAGAFINQLGYFLPLFLVLYLTKRGFSVRQAGLAVGVLGVAAIVASLIGGYLVDRLGSRIVLSGSMLASAALTLIAAIPMPFAGLLVVLAALGAFGQLYRPASGALLAALVPPERRVSASAVMRLGFNLGLAAGPAIAGLLADRSFVWLLAADAATSAVAAVVFALTLRGAAESAPAKGQPASSYGAALGDRGYLVFLLGMLLTTSVYMQAQSTLPLHVRGSGLPNSAFGLLMSFNGILVLVLELPASSITQRLPARPVIAMGSLLVGFGLSLTGVAGSLWALGATVVIWTLGEIAAAAVTSAYVVTVAPAHLRGRYQGLYGLTWSVSRALGPALGTAIYAAWEPSLWMLCALLGIAAAVIIMLASPAQIASAATEPGRHPVGGE